MEIQRLIYVRQVVIQPIVMQIQQQMFAWLLKVVIQQTHMLIPLQICVLLRKVAILLTNTQMTRLRLVLLRRIVTAGTLTEILHQNFAQQPQIVTASINSEIPQLMNVLERVTQLINMVTPLLIYVLLQRNVIRRILMGILQQKNAPWQQIVARQIFMRIQRRKNVLRRVMQQIHMLIPPQKLV
jgi:hypothetical protein